VAALAEAAEANKEAMFAHCCGAVEAVNAVV
jgi:hypothetical protein